MHKPLAPSTITPHLLRQFLDGVLDTSRLPAFLAGQLEQIATRMRRQRARWIKRETKAQRYRAAALAGGGAREVARRRGH
jgi:hypothetical protein